MKHFRKIYKTRYTFADKHDNVHTHTYKQTKWTHTRTNNFLTLKDARDTWCTLYTKQVSHNMNSIFKHYDEIHMT